MSDTQVAENPISNPIIKTRFDFTKLKALLPLFFYLGVALVFSWPLPLNLSDKVISEGASGDVWQHLWNIWWVKFSLLNLHTHPYTTPMLFYPGGANLYFHALDPLDGYISLPFQLLFGLVAAYNLIFILQLTLAGWGAYLLAAYLTGNRRAALAAGLVYACSPLVSRLLNLGQMELTAIEWLPLYILCLLKILNRDERVWLWRGLGVLLLLLLSFSTWYYTLYGLIFSGFYLLYKLGQERRDWRKKWWPTIAAWGGLLAVYALLISPVLLPTLREAGSGGTRQPIFTVIYNSATIQGLFTTGPSALWGIFGSGSSFNPEFRGNFLGYVALLLTGLGLVSCFRKTWFWLAVAGIFLLLALGPILHFSFNPDWEPKTAEQGIMKLPGWWLYYLPLGNIARVPLRYTLVTSLAMTVIIAYGLDWLSKKLQVRWSWAGIAVPALAGLLIFLEFWPLSRPLVEASIPGYYTQLAANNSQWNDFGLLETPDQGNASVISRAMFYQTAHQHPIVGGYLSRKPEYSFRNFPGIKELLNLKNDLLQRDILDRALLKNATGVLSYYKIRYVVVHPQLLRDEDARFEANAVLKTVFGETANSQPEYKDATTEFWRVPELGGKPDALKMLPQLGEGWQARQEATNGVERGFDKQARLVLFNPYQEALKLQLAAPFRAKTAAKLTLLLNEQIIAEPGLNEQATALTFTLTLKPGLNDLILRADQPVFVGKFNFANP